MMRIIYILFLTIFFAVGGYSQVMQTTGGAGGNKFKALKADSFLVVPKGTDTANLANPKWGESTTGALFVKTADSTLWFKVGGQWVQAGGSFTQTVIGNDTTIYEFVIDSTGAAANRVLFAGAKKIRSDSHFLWDSINNKLVINHFNHSIGGVNTKLYVVGNTNLNGSTTTQQMRVSAITQLFNDTTNYKPVIVNSSGDLYKLDRWPSGGGGSGTVTSFSSGDLSPLFTTSVATATTTPALSFSLSNAGAYTVFGNQTNASAASSFAKLNINTIDATGTPSASTYLRGDGSWATVSGGSGVTTVGAFSGSSQTNGASISGSTITFGPADGTNPGMVTTGAQTFFGRKQFDSVIVTGGTSLGDKIRYYDGGSAARVGLGTYAGNVQWYGLGGTFRWSWAKGGDLQSGTTNQLMWLTENNGLNLNVPLVLNSTFSPTNIDFGTPLGAKIYYYNGGAGTRFGIGTNSGNVQYFSTGGSLKWTWNKGGDLQTLGTNQLMEFSENNGLGIGISSGASRLNIKPNESGATSLPAISLYFAYANGAKKSISWRDGTNTVVGSIHNIFNTTTNTTDFVFGDLFNAAYTTTDLTILKGDGRFAIGTTAPSASAIFTTVSTTRGSIPAPSMTRAQKVAISSPAQGLQVYDSDNRAVWLNLNGSTTTWGAIYADQDTVATDAAFTLPVYSSFVILPTITNNRTLTIPAAASYENKTIVIKVANSAGFAWSVSPGILDNTDATVTALTNDKVYTIYSDGTNWHIISLY